MIRTQHKFKRHRVNFSSMDEMNATNFLLSFRDFRNQERIEKVLFSQDVTGEMSEYKSKTKEETLNV